MNLYVELRDAGFQITGRTIHLDQDDLVFLGNLFYDGEIDAKLYNPGEKDLLARMGNLMYKLRADYEEYPEQSANVSDDVSRIANAFAKMRENMEGPD